MRNPIVKSICAIVLSIAVAIGLFMGVEGVSSILHPWPADFAGTFEEVAHQVKTYPPWVLAFLGGFGYGALMLICTFIATRMGHNRNPWHGYGIGVFLFVIVVFNMTMLPYPVWFWILMFTVLPVATYFGTKLAAANTSPT